MISSNPSVVDELGYRALELDRDIPGGIDLDPEEQVHQDVEALRVQDEEAVADEGPSREGRHLPGDVLPDQFRMEPAFPEMTFGVDAVQDPDDHCDGEHQDRRKRAGVSGSPD